MSGAGTVLTGGGQELRRRGDGYCLIRFIVAPSLRNTHAFDVIQPLCVQKQLNTVKAAVRRWGKVVSGRHGKDETPMPKQGRSLIS
jgi:hypothetical protein